MKKFSMQIHYFYNFPKDQAQCLTWRHDHYLKKTLFPFQEYIYIYLVYIGCSVGCKPLLESCKEVKFAWKSDGFSHAQGCGSTGGTAESLLQAAAEQEPAQQRTSGLLCGCTQNLPALCPWGGKAKGWRLTGLSPPPTPLSRLCSPSSSDQPYSHGNRSCVFHAAFRGFPRGSQKLNQDSQPQIILASLHEGSVTDDGTWPLPSD